MYRGMKLADVLHGAYVFADWNNRWVRLYSWFRRRFGEARDRQSALFLRVRLPYNIGQRHEQHIPAGGTLVRTLLRFHEDEEEKSFWRSNSSSTMNLT